MARASCSKHAVEPLDGDDAVQARIGRLSHFVHPARADRGEDLVATELVARAERGQNAGLSPRFSRSKRGLVPNRRLTGSCKPSRRVRWPEVRLGNVAALRRSVLANGLP